jgi:hypothetical protein
MENDTASDDLETLNQMLDDLHEIRGRFGRANVDGDDYRTARVDVAIENIENARDMVEDYGKVGAWPDE